MDVKPTSEQLAIIDAVRRGQHLVIQAGAGTGKTSTLKMVARDLRRKATYLAYNRAAADEAKASFPRHVDCRTGHSLAMGPVGRKWDSVQIAGDFPEPSGRDDIPRADAMLAYVAVTRARKQLDRAGLAWIDRFIAHQSLVPSAKADDRMNEGDCTDAHFRYEGGLPDEGGLALPGR